MVIVFWMVRIKKKQNEKKDKEKKYKNKIPGQWTIWESREGIKKCVLKMVWGEIADKSL